MQLPMSVNAAGRAHPVRGGTTRKAHVCSADCDSKVPWMFVSTSINLTSHVQAAAAGARKQHQINASMHQFSHQTPRHQFHFHAAHLQHRSHGFRPSQTSSWCRHEETLQQKRRICHRYVTDDTGNRPSRSHPKQIVPLMSSKGCSHKGAERIDGDNLLIQINGNQ